MRRPLIPLAIAFIAGILLASQFPVAPGLLLFLAGALCLAAILFAGGRAFLIYPMLILCGWADSSIHTSVTSPNDLRTLLGTEDHLATLRGVLEETPSVRIREQDDKPVFRTLARIRATGLKTEGADWVPVVGRVAVSTPGELLNIFGGQEVEVYGVVAQPELAAAEGTFDYRAYLQQQGIYYRLKASSDKDWKVVRSPAQAPLADRFRDWARKILARGLPAEDKTLRLEWALTLGWKQEMTEEVSEPFVRAATYHIFAVDGLRMAIIFGIFFSLLRAFTLPRWLCGLILLPMIWFYVALTGWPASAIRATVMLSIIIVGWILRRPSDLLNSLFAAAIIILVCDPQQLFQAGFQLSFLVVLCLVLTIPILQGISRRFFAPDPLLPDSLRPAWQRGLRVPLRYVEDLTITSFAAWVGSIPLVAYYFNIVTPVSTPANILAVPLCGLVLICNLASLIFGAWLPFAADLFNQSGWFLMKCIEVSSDWFARLPRAYIYVQAPNLFTSVLYYGILLGLLTGWLLLPRLRMVKVVTVSIASITWLFIFWGQHSAQHLAVLSLPSGYSIFCKGGRSEDLLIDCGTTNAVQSVVKPYLRAQGVNRLQTMLLTVGHVNQAGGAPLVADLFQVRQVLTSGVKYQSAAYRVVQEELADRPLVMKTVEPGSGIGPWEVIYPQESEAFLSADDKPLVLWGKIRQTTVLITSTLSPNGQDMLMERYPGMEADILISGLPGRAEPVTDRFLAALHPRLVIICDSRYPARAQASAKLRARLARVSIPVIYTSKEGAATIDFHDHYWSARTMSGRQIDSRNVTPFSAPAIDDPSAE